MRRALRCWHQPRLRTPQPRRICLRAVPGGLVAFVAFHEIRPSIAEERNDDLATENIRLRRELARLREERATDEIAPSTPAPFVTNTYTHGKLTTNTLEGARVFVWGQRSAFPVCQASGDLEPEGDVRAPVEVKWFRIHAEHRNCLWHQIAFGPSFGVARTNDGDIFLWGSYRTEGSRKYMAPQKLHYDKAKVDSNIRDLQCSASAVWALTTEGEVLVWERVPQKILEAGSVESIAKGARAVGGFNRPVKNMSIGPSHAAFVLDDGEIYCLGSNRFGECALDPNKHTVAAVCHRVQLPQGANPILQACCGEFHTVALSSNGQGYAWGDDSKIQLGLGDTRSNFGDERPFSGSQGYQRFLKTGEAMAPAAVLKSGPDAHSLARPTSTSKKKYGEFEPHFKWQASAMQEIPIEFERQVHGIPYPPAEGLVCGHDFTILAVRDSPDWFAPEEETNRLFCCGENGKGQCGRNMQQSQQIFAAARLPRHSRTHSVACGAGHCLAVLKKIGAGRQKSELWGWGNNERGQASGAKQGWVCPASRIRLPASDVRIEAACCGFSSSAVICSQRRLQRQPSDGLDLDEGANDDSGSGRKLNHA